MQFKARLAAVRGTPSRADDVRTVVRLNLEAHDISSDWLFSQLGEDLVVNLAESSMSMGPLFEAEDAGEEVEDRTNGHVEEADAGVPAAGRRRRGTRSSEQG
ncbi:MAG TPA: hypothetical protein VKB34_06370 [Povalibacter sp.]|nr:hypothetical protein [Povalibacter sp.]